MSAPRAIGLMVPANNTTMEGELAAWLPPGSRVLRVGIPRGPGLLTAETMPAYRDAAVALARQASSAKGLMPSLTAARRRASSPGPAATRNSPRCWPKRPVCA